VIRVKVATPTYAGLHPDCQKSIDALQGLEGFEFTQRTRQSSLLLKARNELLEPEYFDYILGVDDDIRFSVEDFFKLWEPRAPIVFGAVRYHLLEHTFVAGKWIEGYPGNFIPGIPAIDRGRVEMDFSGPAFFLLNCNEMRPGGRLFGRYPYFRCPVIITAPGTSEHPLEAAGEDIGFCLLLQEAGIPVLLETGVKVDHLKDAKV
jgi:hypothetical protein